MAKLSKTMQEALDGMMWKYNKAQGTTFETWYMGHPKHYQTWLNEHTKRFGERITNNTIERQRRIYEDAVNGIVVTGANLGTLTALERRGIIEILTPSSNGNRVKLLNV